MAAKKPGGTPQGKKDAPRAAPPPVAASATAVGEQDLFLWNEGTHRRAYRVLGAHLAESGGQQGVAFAVWAPNAERASVVGDFQGWTSPGHALSQRGSSGIWEGFVPGLGNGTVYKYRIWSRHAGYVVDKADPFGRRHETPPRTGSVVWDTGYQWNDAEWLRSRYARNGLGSPMSIYEVHLGSWRHAPEDGNRPLTYREAAPALAAYAKDMGFTHVELMPIMEHPFYGSWGYQTTGYFAPTSRFGPPEDFAFLVDTLHQEGIGVILDWVPAHFPTDEHGLAYFDGTHLFEHADRRLGHHPDWDTYVFNYGRHEVRSFLLSSAFFWLDVFHADGLRIDAVASMLYLDYSRKPGEWIPNIYGGRENLDAISFLRQMNADVYKEYPDTQTFAEESTAWPGVSRPLYVGGLGFGFKWDMGWMHDTLQYMHHEPIHRRYHQNDLTFRSIYAGSENFVLPLSHDEVVHGKGSLLDKMAGVDRQEFANLRLLFGYMFAQTGKKLLFMGAGDRPGARVAPRAEPRLAPPRDRSPRRGAGLGEGPQPAPRRRARPARARLRAGGHRLDRHLRRREQRAGPAPLGRGGRPAHHGGHELHPGGAHRLPAGRAAPRLLEGDPEQRRPGLRRRRVGQHGRPRGRGRPEPRPAGLADAHPPAARRHLPEARLSPPHSTDARGTAALGVE